MKLQHVGLGRSGVQAASEWTLAALKKVRMNQGDLRNANANPAIP